MREELSADRGGTRTAYSFKLVPIVGGRRKRCWERKNRRMGQGWDFLVVGEAGSCPEIVYKRKEVI